MKVKAGVPSYPRVNTAVTKAARTFQFSLEIDMSHWLHFACPRSTQALFTPRSVASWWCCEFVPANRYLKYFFASGACVANICRHRLWPSLESDMWMLEGNGDGQCFGEKVTGNLCKCFARSVRFPDRHISRKLW